MKSIKSSSIVWGLLVSGSLLGLSLAGSFFTLQDQTESPVAEGAPRYDEKGDLLLPKGWEGWPLVGSSLGLGYSGTPGSGAAFHHVHMEPAAYEHYNRTGEFSEKTMFALAIFSQGEKESIARSGSFSKDFLALELAVKDHERFEEGWAYYDFGRRPRAKSKAFPKSNCYSCHVENGQTDNVFVQFYAMLKPPVAGPGAESVLEPAAAGEEQATLALRGLDPVLLTRGKQEQGKAEFVESYGGYLYRFANAESKAAFSKESQRFAIQNEMCPVIPSAQADSALFYVHEAKIYIFASEGCIDNFKESPESYLPVPK